MQLLQPRIYAVVVTAAVPSYKEQCSYSCIIKIVYACPWHHNNEQCEVDSNLPKKTFSYMVQHASTHTLAACWISRNLCSMT